MIRCDTRPLVAAALSNDDDHRASVELFTGMHLAGRALLAPATVIAETGYLLAREAGARVDALFLTSVAASSSLISPTRTWRAGPSSSLSTRTCRSARPTTRSLRSPNASRLTRSPLSIIGTSPWCGPGMSTRSRCGPDIDSGSVSGSEAGVAVEP